MFIRDIKKMDYLRVFIISAVFRTFTLLFYAPIEHILGDFERKSQPFRYN